MKALQKQNISDSNTAKLKELVLERYNLDLLVEEIVLILGDYGVETFLSYIKGNDTELLEVIDSKFYFSLVGQSLEVKLDDSIVLEMVDRVKSIGYITSEVLYS